MTYLYVQLTVLEGLLVEDDRLGWLGLDLFMNKWWEVITYIHILSYTVVVPPFNSKSCVHFDLTLKYKRETDIYSYNCKFLVLFTFIYKFSSVRTEFLLLLLRKVYLFSGRINPLILELVIFPSHQYNWKPYGVISQNHTTSIVILNIK